MKNLEPYFLNVDLDITSVQKLDPIVDGLKRRVVVLYSGPTGKGRTNLLVLESSRTHKNPDAAIHALCSALERLPPDAMAVWQAATKEFNIGYDSPNTEHSTSFRVNKESAQRMMALGITLAVTIYRSETGEPTVVKKVRRKTV